MKVNFKSFIAGILLGSIGITSVVAAPISKMINAIYSISGISIDGVDIFLPEDSKPFIVDGKTYLPVRVIAEALDKTVDFNSTTSKVIINSKGTASSGNVVGNLIYAMVSGSTNTYTGVRDWNKGDMDNAGKMHTTGIRYSTNGDKDKDVTVDIGLLGEYSRFKGQFVITQHRKEFLNTFNLDILADDKVIKTIKDVKAGMIPQNLDLNVSGINKLTFKLTNSYFGNEYIHNVEFGVVDVDLYK